MNGPSKSDKKIHPEWFDWPEWAAAIAGGVVVVGVILEYFPKERLVSPGLVAIGVAAEVFFSLISTRRSKAAEQIANATVAELGKQAAEALQAAEHERLERVKLEADLSPRLFDKQHKAIARLRQFAVAHVILQYPMDIECHETAEQIAFVLEESAWEYTPRVEMNIDPLLRYGVIVDGRSGDNAEAASALIHVLNEGGIDAQFFPPGVPGGKDEILISVGAKIGSRGRAMHKHVVAMQQAFIDDTAAGRIPNLEPFIQAIKRVTGEREPGMYGLRKPLPWR